MTDRIVAGPCPEHEDACLAAAWGRAEDPAWASHREDCARCRQAFEAARTRAQHIEPQPPERIRADLATAVFERTTRAPVRAPWRWGWAGAAFAAAGAAYLALRPQERLPPDGTEFLAEVDLDLLEDLDLAENLELLELLDALEELEDA